MALRQPAMFVSTTYSPRLKHENTAAIGAVPCTTSGLSHWTCEVLCGHPRPAMDLM